MVSVRPIVVVAFLCSLFIILIILTTSQKRSEEKQKKQVPLASAINSELGVYPIVKEKQEDQVPLATQSVPISVSKVEEEKQTEQVKQFENQNETTCCLIAAKHPLEDLCSTDYSTPVISSHCNCTDYIMCKLVMVTALSSNHFKESMDYFGSVYEMFPRTKIIVYDLGLTVSEVSRIQSYCNVQEVRKFKFDQYPSHTKNLHTYAWKPFLISEMSQEYEVFFYCDSSCRMNKMPPRFLLNLLKLPILPAARLKGSMVRFTHDGMLKYLGVKETRQELVDFLSGSFPGGANIFWANDVFKDKFLPPYIDCASHAECIAPAGASLFGCNFKLPKDRYVGCHRYDQSALNLVLIEVFGETFAALYGENGEVPVVKLVNIHRGKTNHYNNSRSHECNIMY